MGGSSGLSPRPLPRSARWLEASSEPGRFRSDFVGLLPQAGRPGEGAGGLWMKQIPSEVSAPAAAFAALRRGLASPPCAQPVPPGSGCWRAPLPATLAFGAQMDFREAEAFQWHRHPCCWQDLATGFGWETGSCHHRPATTVLEAIREGTATVPASRRVRDPTASVLPVKTISETGCFIHLLRAPSWLGVAWIPSWGTYAGGIVFPGLGCFSRTRPPTFQLPGWPGGLVGSRPHRQGVEP